MGSCVMCMCLCVQARLSTSANVRVVYMAVHLDLLSALTTGCPVHHHHHCFGMPFTHTQVTHEDSPISPTHPWQYAANAIYIESSASCHNDFSCRFSLVDGSPHTHLCTHILLYHCQLNMMAEHLYPFKTMRSVSSCLWWHQVAQHHFTLSTYLQRHMGTHNGAPRLACVLQPTNNKWEHTMTSTKSIRERRMWQSRAMYEFDERAS